MLKRLVRWLSGLTFRQTVCAGVLSAIAMEALTCLLRFGAHMTAGDSMHWMSSVTFGWRIHHGYVGVLLACCSLLFRPGWLRNSLLMIGTGLFVSDLVHHFAVLWPLTGSPELLLRYPD